MFLRPQRHGRLEPPSYACSDSAGSMSFRAGWPRPNQRSCRSSRALHEAFGSTMMPLRPPFGPHGVKVRSRAKSTVSSPSNARGPGGPVSRSSGSGFSRRPEPTHLKTALISRAGMGCAFKTRDARPSPKDTRGHPGRQEEPQGQRGPPPHQTPRKGQSASHHHEKCGRAKFQSRLTPKHGSWLNIAEIELAVLSKTRACHGAFPMRPPCVAKSRLVCGNAMPRPSRSIGGLPPRCKGLKSKTAGTAFIRNSGPDYLQLSEAPGQNCLPLSLQSIEAGLKSSGPGPHYLPLGSTLLR
jgi:hypothetical protein